MTVLAARGRVCVARSWDEGEVDRLYVNLHEELGKLRQKLSEADSVDTSDRWAVMRYNTALKAIYGYVRAYAVPIGEWVVQTRTLPRGFAKKVEIAVRETKKKPRDIWKAWPKLRKHLGLLLEARKWPPKGSVAEDESKVFLLGPFEVHNTLEIEGAKLDKVKEIVTLALKALKKGGVKFHRVAYGPIYIVGQLRQAHHAAWYNIDHDDIYVRPLRSGNETQHLLHELGHRYWAKFLTTDQKRAWLRYDRTLERQAEDVELPRTGDLFPVPLRDREEAPTIVGIKTDRRGNMMYELSGGGYFSLQKTRNYLDRQSRALQYPTPYSATHPEEHFAEAFALHLLGTLGDSHEAKFLEFLA